MRSPRRLGCSDPSLHLTPTCAPYVVDALEGDDDAEGSISREFVRIPRNAARADTYFDLFRAGTEKNGGHDWKSVRAVLAKEGEKLVVVALTMDRWIP
jgi:hypothetical protein